jgi:hypothetical protein
VSESIIAEITRLKGLSTAQLQQRWLEVFGESTRSRHHAYLWKRLAWEYQARLHGGLSHRALDRLRELAADGPRFLPPRDASAALDRVAGASGRRRDHRLPAPGTVIIRRWREQDLRLLVREDGGFELDGKVFQSLTEAARAATGSAWNGRLFWGVSKRKRTS